MNSNSDKKQSHNELKSDDNSNEQEIKDFEFQGINSQNSEINKDNNDIINTDNKNTETNDEPIYVMTLALEQGKSEKIEIFANSDPSELAYNFCSKNNLDFNALDYLREQITNLLENYTKNENEEDNDNEENNDNKEINEGFSDNNNNDNDKEENIDINIPEIEEIQEDLEFNSTGNYKENTQNKKIKENDNNIELDIDKNDNNNNNNNEKEIELELNDNENKEQNEDINENNNNEMNTEIVEDIDNNLNIVNENINNKEEFEIENNNQSMNKEEDILSNIININNNKRRNYKMNEDIIIGYGEYDNKNKLFNDNSISNNNINNTNNIIPNLEHKEEDNILFKNKNITDQILTNNINNQETKSNTNTNINIIQNEDDENNINIFPSKNDKLGEQEFLEDKTENIKNYKKIKMIKPLKNVYNSEKNINKDMTKLNQNFNKNSNYKLRKLTKLKEEYDKKYSFKPVINDNYKTDLTFNERLNIFNNISKIKKEELKNNLSNLKDKDNGQEYFKPKLISNQNFYHKKVNNSTNNINLNDQENIDIFKKNYLYWKKYNLDKEKLYDKFYENSNGPIFYNKIKSDKIVSEANKKAFINLFNVLDSDQDDLITSVSINLNNVPNNIIKIIEPLLIELKEDNQTLNQEEFIKAMNKLFENISSIDRRHLINEYSNYNLKKNRINLYKNKNIKINNYYKFNNNNINNIFSSRPKTPLYNNCNNIYKNNMFNNNPGCISNLQPNKEKKIVNKNTNKLAEKHYIKMQKMMNNYNNKYNIYSKPTNKNDINKDSFIGNKSRFNNNLLYNKTPNSNYMNFFCNNNSNNKKFTFINDCTFNNYLKNLN